MIGRWRWPRNNHHLRQGELAEQQAYHYLLGQGLTLLARNFRTRRGEIDLIMEQGETLVFVEVRFRTSDQFGGAAASVDRHKRQRLIAAAKAYLQQQRRELQPCRFDLVALSAENPLEWIQNIIED